MSNIYGRQVVVLLVNKSGGGVIAGDVVVVGTANNDAFTTTTSAASTGTVGIAQETIASNATGRVLVAGYAALINTTASVTRQNYGTTSTTVKKAVDAGASRTTGTFVQFLTGGTTPDGIVYNADLGAGSGAPTTSQYLVGVADGALSAEKVKAALYKNYDPDEYPASPSAEDDEFDDGSVAGAWGWVSAAPSVYNETKFPGHFYAEIAAGTTNKFRKSYTPGASTAFGIAAKCSMGGVAQDSTAMTWGIAAFDASDNVIDNIYMQTSGTAAAWETMRILSTGGTLMSLVAPTLTVYFALARDASNVYLNWYSFDGKLWVQHGTTTSSTAITKIGFVIPTNATGGTRYVTADFFRRFSALTSPPVIGA